MRIRNIRIKQWRNFENIELQLDHDAGLVCIVGANGTGKSHLLELIATCVHKLGLSQGVEIPRGDPFNDQHRFCLQFYLAEGIGDDIDSKLQQESAFFKWDRTLTINSENGPEIGCRTTIRAGGITDTNESENFAQCVVGQLQQSNAVHFLSLDADRAYPKKNLNVNQIAEAYEIDWEGVEYTKGRSYRKTSTLYDEWIKYFLAQENQSGTQLIKETRLARQSGAEDPKFKDHFLEYKDDLISVLPHLVFTGVDSKRHTLLFDTTNLELSFDQLSGGEREIAFLIGQVDRFGLRQGIFLLDEPELHLNTDLIRSWVAYLTNSVQTGQIWLATHSLEAVEAAGQQATFVLERNLVSKKVDSISRLDKRPILSALSRAVGTPAFSISQLIFVFIEGEEGIGERERFRKLAGLPQDIRFMECGSCNEVLRRVDMIKSLSKEAGVEIRIGGMVDRDFRSCREAKGMSDDRIFVLPVHEVENFFLHPSTLQFLLKQNGKSELIATDLIRDTSDKRAGSWIFQNAMATNNAKKLRKISSHVKEQAKSLSWVEIGDNQDAAIKKIIDSTDFSNDEIKKFQNLLKISIATYKRNRTQDTLWKICEGKQAINDVACKCGYAGMRALELASFVAWNRPDVQISVELSKFRDFLLKL